MFFFGYFCCFFIKKLIFSQFHDQNDQLINSLLVQELVLKLCDFGTATVLTEQRPRSLVNIGTLSYTAPEAPKGDVFGEKKKPSCVPFGMENLESFCKNLGILDMK